MPEHDANSVNQKMCDTDYGCLSIIILLHRIPELGGVPLIDVSNRYYDTFKKGTHNLLYMIAFLGRLVDYMKPCYSDGVLIDFFLPCGAY